MSRLTTKGINYLELYCRLAREDSRERGRADKYFMADKLSKLEDIEEMLGMELISAVELCKKANEQHYVYIQESWGLSKIKFIDDLDIELFNHRLYSNSRGVWYSFDLKEYGITWWLRENKEE